MALNTAFSALVINHFFRNLPQPAVQPYVGILLAITDESTGDVTEVASAGYNRIALPMTAPGSSATESSAQLNFPDQALQVTAVGIGLFSEPIGGVLMRVLRFPAPRTIPVGDKLVINAGDIDLSFTAVN